MPISALSSDTSIPKQLRRKSVVQNARRRKKSRELPPEVFSYRQIPGGSINLSV